MIRRPLAHAPDKTYAHSRDLEQMHLTHSQRAVSKIGISVPEQIGRPEVACVVFNPGHGVGRQDMPRPRHALRGYPEHTTSTEYQSKEQY